MDIWRYQLCGEVEIHAPLEQVYALTCDPVIIPSYAQEIDRIQKLGSVNSRGMLVRSYFKVALLTFGVLYRYRYRPPTHYSGVQERGSLLRGFFTFRFRSCQRGTKVSHMEGVGSSVPFVAPIVGFIYFKIIARGGIETELRRLKHLVETPMR